MFRMKKMFSGGQIWKWPTRKEWVIFVVLVAIYMFCTAFVLNGDGSYGYAMVQKITDPGAFSSNDLALNGSLKGNFLFYKILAFLPFFQDNFVAWDFAMSFFLSIFLLLCWYNIFIHLIDDKIAVWLGFFFMLFTDERLSLGGATIPLFYLSSIVSVLHLQIFSLLLFFKKYYLPCFILLGFTTYFHPAAGFFFLLVLGATLFFESIKEKKVGEFAKIVTVSALICLPNLVLLKSNLDINAVSGDFFSIFYPMKGGHAYPQDYYFAYLFTLISLVLAGITFRKKIFDINNQKIIFKIILFTLIAVVVWLVNLFFIKNLFVFYLYFAMRSTYILKPLIALLLSIIAFALVREKKFLSLVAAGLILVSLISPNYEKAWIFLAPVLVWVLIRDYFASFDEQVYNFFKRFFFKFNRKALVYIPAAALVVVALILFGNKFNNKWVKLVNLTKGQNDFNFSFNKELNFGINKSNPDFSSVLNWAKNFKGKMIIVPPDNCLMNTFRFITKNSVYINTCDMAQLTYVPENYFEGWRRMQQIGFRIKSRGEFDTSLYYVLDLVELKEKGAADYIIFDKFSPDYKVKKETPIFQNDHYIVYSLK